MPSPVSGAVLRADTRRKLSPVSVYRSASSPITVSGSPLLACPVVELLQNQLELLWEGETKMGGILQNGEAVVGDGPEDDRCAQDTRLVQHMDVKHLGNPDK